MSAKDDYPALAKSIGGVLHISDELDLVRRDGRDALDEIDRLREQAKEWEEQFAARHPGSVKP